MIPFEYQISQKDWPLKATDSARGFFFSGTFSADRIGKENSRKLFNTIKILCLYFLACIGGTAFILNAWVNFPEKQLWHELLFRQNLLLFIFWLSVLGDLYLWADSIQYKQGLNKYSLPNLLSQTTDEKKQPIDVFEYFDCSAKNAWNNGIKEAKKNGSAITSTQIFACLLKERIVKHFFLRLGENSEDLHLLCKKYLEMAEESENENSEIIEKLPFVALNEALKLHNKKIDCLMLLCALVSLCPEKSFIQSIFFNLNMDLEKTETAASWIFNIKILAEEMKIFEKLAKFKPDSEINRGLTSVPTPNLNRFSSDLTFRAKHGRLPLAMGRETDLKEILKMLGEDGRNLLLIGEEGTGRTTIVNELAYKMASEQVPKHLQDKRLIKLELSAIVANADKAETSLLNCLSESLSSGNVVIVLEDLHLLTEAKTTQGLNLLEILLDFLLQNPLLTIASTDISGYQNQLKTSANFAEAFESYELLPLDERGITLASCIKASLLEHHHNCFFTFPAISEAVNLSNRFLHNVGQPQKTIAILVEAAARSKNQKGAIINQKLIETIMSEKTHIPAQTVSQDESEILLNLEDKLSKFVVGQKTAVVAVSEALRRARAGLEPVSRPLGSFLFLGPTGVGKTELARALAKIFFGRDETLLRLDMSEFRGEDGMEKLLGKPGKQDSVIVKHLKNNPFCLILLDEFEKSSLEIRNLFLQILEDGRLTSANGETLDLTECLIIATSNAGSGEIQEGIRHHLTLDQIKPTIYNKILKTEFSPELINRFDGVILFSSLNEEEIETVTRMELSKIQNQLLQKGVKAYFSDNVCRYIANSGFDESLGARPIRRFIQDKLESLLAKLLLSGKLPRGSEVVVDFEKGKLVVK